jgi:hypothetical protein
MTMPVLRSFLALLAGFLTMAVIAGIITAALRKLTPHWLGLTNHLNAGYVLINLSYSLAAAMMGGYITAWLARDRSLTHVFVLALIALLVAALSALQQRGQQPIWYQLLLVAITPLGVLIGGLIRLRVIGI